MRLYMMPQVIPTRPAHVADFALKLLVIASMSLAGCVRHPLRKGDALAQKVSEYQDSAPNFYDSLQRLSERSNLHLGVEIGKGFEDKTTSVSISRGTISDVVNAIMKTAPSYTWSDYNGIINIQPRHNSDGLSQLRIARFQVVQASSRGVKMALISLPEVKDWMIRNQVTERSFAEGTLIGTEDPQPPISILVINVTVQTIMNAIVTKPGWHSWLLSRYGDQNQYLNVQIN